MRSMTALILVVLSSATAEAQESRSDRDRLDAAIARGLAFLAKDAMEWKEEHNCVSCHHAGLVVWSLREAKQRGHAVDEPVLAELTQWVAGSSGDGRTSQPRPEGRPKALNAKALWLALGLGADPSPEAATRAGIRPLLETVKADQTEDGSWSAWPDTRPPIFGDSDESMTALAALALLPHAASGDETARAAREKAVRWLSETKSDDDPQSLAMRLVLWKRLGRPDEESSPLVERIKDRQNADGGWSQAAGMPSDAWATGQALYALAHAGLTADDPAIARGQSFLVQTQREDGSWPMTSRPTKPGGEGAKSLIPITAAGSSWAVLGLVRSR
jgi:hypothetical protein